LKFEKYAQCAWNLQADPIFKNLKTDPHYRDLYERTGHKDYDDYMAKKKE
jgi:hypothetical protein